MNSKKNILVADNDPDTSRAVRFHLKMLGYQVFTASNPAQALQMLEEEIIHLAIIDLRLKNDREVEHSGLEVAEKVPGHIPFIIYTAFEDTWVIKRALGKIGAREIIDKKMTGASKRLIDTVNRLFKEDVKANFNLVIDEMISCGEIAEKIKITTKKGPRPSSYDVCQILESLFYTAESITVSPLGSVDSLQSRHPSRSLVVVVQPRYKNGLGEKRVVKFGEGSEILKGKYNYEKIMPFVGGTRLPVLGETAFSRKLGGAVYTLIDAGWEKMQAYTTYFQEQNSPNALVLPLRCFFGNVWIRFYKDSFETQKPLFKLYEESLHLSEKPDDIENILLFVPSGSLNLPNPYEYALKHSLDSKIPGSQLARTHGDLCADHIFTDGDHVWIIDFDRSGEGHILRDFARLEVDILTRLTAFSERDLKVFFELLVTLVKPLSPVLMKPSGITAKIPLSIFDHLAAMKALTTIVELRTLASAITQFHDVREYYWAILMEALATNIQSKTEAQQNQSIILAAVVADRLQHFMGEWNFAEIEWTTWKDRASSLVRRRREEADVNFKSNPSNDLHNKIIRLDFELELRRLWDVDLQ